MRPVISVNHLGKQYRLGSKSREDTLRDQIAGGFRRLFQSKNEKRKTQTQDEFFWALKDLSFEVAQGEVVGILGRNGAGKSTLLKVLSQITEPTEGEVRMRGRIASLLEVGTGFHPELSGRENVYLNGAILGMSRSEIKKKFDEIAAFAEVEKFLDTPVKRYSSGMYVRLAFAVAAHLESEILVVDEVLAVGDAAFQKKCLGKMKDIGSSGRTVIFVSHNMATVSNLCTRGIVIEQGRIGFDGGVTEAIRHYTHAILARNASQQAKDSNVIYSAPQTETKDFFVTKIEFLSLDGLPKQFIATWDGVIIRFHYHCSRAVQRAAVVAQVFSFDGKSLFNISTEPDGTLPLAFKVGHAAVDLVIPKFPLAAGEYILGVGLAIPWVEYLFIEQGLASFTVFPRDVYGSGVAPVEPRSSIAFEHTWRDLGTP